ncbi:hypothetical protein HT031_000554 [Scenedesmus sp. PABB004]|nr:hypothetical protein HT031_000554 [Scenedesmus sp. PABB004]
MLLSRSGMLRPAAAQQRAGAAAPLLRPPLPPALTAPPRRRRAAPVCGARRRSSPVSEGLALVLEDELKVEKERYRTPDAVLGGPPCGFELEDRPNSNLLLLSRRFGGEEVLVEVDLDAQHDDGDEGEFGEEDDDDEDGGALPPVTFLVSIAKGGAVLGFSCETAGEDVAITHISLNDAPLGGGEGEGEDGEDDDDDAPPYTGPLFTELDDTLQQAFADYLEERGVNAELGAYLVELVHDKLEVEYMSWLTRVQAFVQG